MITDIEDASEEFGGFFFFFFLSICLHFLDAGVHPYSFWFKKKKFFFKCGPFLKSLLNLLQYCFCFMLCFFLAMKHSGILVPWSGIKPHTPCLGRWSLNHWTTKEIPNLWFLLTLLLVRKIYLKIGFLGKANSEQWQIAKWGWVHRLMD